MARSVEHTDYISAEEKEPSYKYCGYNTKQSDGEDSVSELPGM